MPRYSTAFGMDVHLRSTTVCALDAETGEAVTRRFRGNPWGEVAEWMSGFPGPSLAAYESGYLGFAPQGSSPGSASTASSRPSPRSRGRLPTSRPRTTATTRPGWPRRYCRTTSPRYGCRPPRSRGSGTSPPPTTRRREARGGEAAAPGVPSPPRLCLRRHDAAGNPRKYWTYGFLRWLDGIHPATTEASGRLRR